ncbi:MAG: DUF3667 domain-containing protein [Bacteroidota bacterium]
MAKGKRFLTKGRYELQFRGTKCLNCGHPLDKSDKYCPNCSQANSTKKLVLKDFIDEFFSGLINYDSKLVKTLYTMLIKPGTITRDYIAGKRVSYTNPFRFLLSLAFLYFLMVTFNNNRFSSMDDFGLEEKIENADPINLDFTFGEDEEKDSVAIDTVLQVQADSVLKNKVIPNYSASEDEAITYNLEAEIGDDASKDSLMLANPKVFYHALKGKGFSSLAEKTEFYYKLISHDSVKNLEEAREKYKVSNHWSDQMAFDGAKSINRALARPGSWVKNTLAKLPFVVFVFLPLFTIFIFLAYIRKKYTYTDHLVFSFHTQSLLFILLIISWVVDSLFHISTAGFSLLIFSIYLFQSMRKFYGQGVFKTIVKFIFLNVVFMVLGIISVTLLFTGSIFTY